MISRLKELVDESSKIVIMQADNPDADSLGSSLALEQILGEMGKETFLYCGVDIPGYLKYLNGWDRVSPEIPAEFDFSIMVDSSTLTLFQKLSEGDDMKLIAKKPCVILDHHTEVDNIVPFALLNITDRNVSSTGELIYNIANKLKWPFDKNSALFVMASILGDTQGLSNDLTTADTFRVMASLIDIGVDRVSLEEKRRLLSKMHHEIFLYKAHLIKHTEFYFDNQLALIVIPQGDITKYSPLYNPNALIQPEHLQTENVRISIAIKNYDDHRATAAIRCNTDTPIAGKLAEKFGGGGHIYSAGFRISEMVSIDKLKSDCLSAVSELLENCPRNYRKETRNETI